MAELATIARPYAEALFKAGGTGDATALSAEVKALARVAADPQLRQYADDPHVSANQLFELLASVAQRPGEAPLSTSARNFLQVVIDNGRLAALPAIATQFQALLNAHAGVSQGIVYSAFAITPEQLGEIGRDLGKRFGSKLDLEVVVDPALIGGIRVVVGDEVLDLSIKARLEQMKAALTA